MAQAEGTGRRWLPAAAVHDLLAAYGIASLPMVIAADPAAAAQAARPWIEAGQRAVLKIVSPDIAHKSDVGGVALNLETVEAVQREAAAMLERVRAFEPSARIDGLLVQPMVERAHARELIAGIADDALFGPVILFGAGGVAVEVEKDTALGLPPLHLNLAHDLIQRTRVSRRLNAYRNLPAANRGAAALTLVKLSQLAARVLIDDFDPAMYPRVPFGNPRFAIAPYPKEMEGELRTHSGRVFHVRPVRPEDEARLRRFFAGVSADDLRQRYFSPVKQISQAFIARLTQIDYARVIVLLAVDGGDEVLGVAQVHADPELHEGEYAILLRSDLKGQGLGWALMQRLIEVAKRMGLKQITGQVLRDNTSMLDMCRQLGFSIAPDPEDGAIALVQLPVAEGGTP